MTIKGVLFRFLLIYFVLLFVAGIAVSILGIRGSHSYIGFGILVGCVLWVCAVFIKKNGRYFSDAEKVAVVVGMIVIDLLLQVLPIIYSYSQQPKPNMAYALLDLGIFGLLHAALIYLCVNSAKKWFIIKTEKGS